MVIKIANQRTMISIKANKGDLRPKNRIDQNIFKTNCIRNMCKAGFTNFLLIPLFQIMPALIPIKIKRIVQTGAKSQFGGLKLGLFKVEYQVEIAGVVKTEPIKPTNRQIRIEIIIFFIFFL